MENKSQLQEELEKEPFSGEERESWIWHKEWDVGTRGLADGIRLEFYAAMNEYLRTGRISRALKPFAEAVFRVCHSRAFDDRQKYFRKLRACSESGKKGMKSRWEKARKPMKRPLSDDNENNGRYPAITKITDNDTDNVNVSPDGDKKETKKEKIALSPNVSMTESERQTLVQKHGEAAFAEMVEILDAYKAASGKRYKSDAGAIRSWVVGEWEKRHSAGGGSPRPFPQPALPGIAASRRQPMPSPDLDAAEADLRERGLLQ